MIGRALAATRVSDREATAFALGGFVTLAAIGVEKPMWLLGALPVWAYTMGFVFRDRPERLGLPTLLTLARGLLLAMAAGFVFYRGRVTLAALAYSVAVVLDDLDGRVARKLGQTSLFGAKLDMEIDAAGVLIATTLGILYGKLPVWYLAIGLARYAFVLGHAVRRRWGRTPRALDPSRIRRLLAGSSMGFLAAALWPVVPADVTMQAAIVFGGATLLMFARDFWYTSRTASP